MKQLLNSLKATLLLGALAIFAWSAVPSNAAAAAEGGDCVPPGEECHFVAHGVLYHGKGDLTTIY